MAPYRAYPPGRDTTIEGAGYRGVPYPEIRCPDRHLADAEDISLGLSLCGRQVVIRDLESSVRVVRELLLKLLLPSVFALTPSIRHHTPAPPSALRVPRICH